LFARNESARGDSVIDDLRLFGRDANIIAYGTRLTRIRGPDEDDPSGSATRPARHHAFHVPMTGSGHGHTVSGGWFWFGLWLRLLVGKDLVQSRLPWRELPPVLPGKRSHHHRLCVNPLEFTDDISSSIYHITNCSYKTNNEQYAYLSRCRSCAAPFCRLLLEHLRRFTFRYSEFFIGLSLRIVSSEHPINDRPLARCPAGRGLRHIRARRPRHC